MRTLLALLFLAWPALAQDAPGVETPGAEVADKPDEPQLVSVDLVGTVKTIHAGEKFLVGVRLRIEDGYHVYWRNPGDSGGATEAQLRAPKGFSVGPVMYPAPHRLEQAGGLTVYGYEGEAILFFEVTAPAELPEGRNTVFHGGARWLACKTECVPGRGVGQLRLGLSKRKPKKKIERPDGFATLGPHLARLPRPLPQHESWKLRWLGTEDKPILSIKLPKGTQGEFFPLEDDQNRFLRLRSMGGSVALHQSFLVGEQVLPRVRGSLLITDGKKTVCYSINRVWKDAPLVEPKNNRDKEGD